MATHDIVDNTHYWKTNYYFGKVTSYSTKVTSNSVNGHQNFYARGLQDQETKIRRVVLPIDDLARFWAIFFLDEVWEVELRKFSEKKKKRILSGLEPMLIPLTGQCNY